MTLYEMNLNALSALKHGDFINAQNLFKNNCKSNDYRAINNLGIYYYENGIMTKNNKIISGDFLGKKYVQKAYELKRTPITVSNLAKIVFQYDKNYDIAYQLYQEANSLDVNNDFIYNMGVCLYELKKYDDVLKIIEKNSKTSAYFFELYCFSLIKKNNKFLWKFYSQNYQDEYEICEDLIIIIKYFSNIQKISKKEIDEYLSQWFPNEYMWAIIIDICITNNIYKPQQIVELYKKISYNNKINNQKTINKFIESKLYRQNFIESNIYYHPTLKENCGYFGCPMHKTLWE